VRNLIPTVLSKFHNDDLTVPSSICIRYGDKAPSMK